MLISISSVGPAAPGAGSHDVLFNGRGGWPETASAEFLPSRASLRTTSQPQRQNQRQQALVAERAACYLGRRLTADAQFLDHRAVALDILALQIVEQAPSLADDLEQTPPRVVVLLVGPEMLGQIGDSLRQEGNLDFGRTSVPFVGPELFNNL